MNTENIPEDVRSELSIPVLTIPSKDQYEGRVTPSQVHDLDLREVKFAAALDRFEQRTDDVVKALLECNRHLRMLEARLILMDKKASKIDRVQIQSSSTLTTLRAMGSAALGAVIATIIARWMLK